jgi:hypothetical protein
MRIFRDTKDLAILVFPTYPSIIKDVKLSTIKKLKENDIVIHKIIQEKYFFSMYLNKPIQASNIISSFVGIKKIEIAYSSANNIKSIISNIIKIGQKIIVDEKFFIRVFSENANFLPRDIEFIATGILVEKLTNKISRPSTNEESASKVMRVYIGNSKSYISWKSLNGIGGNSYGKIKKKAFIIIYNQLSLFSLKKIIQMGFFPDILILYWDYMELKNILLSLHQILNNISIHKLKLKLLQLSLLIPERSNLPIDILVNLLIIDICSYFTNLLDVVIPFNLILHPTWLIDYSMNFCIKNGKIPWLPNLFEEDAPFIPLGQNFDNNRIAASNVKRSKLNAYLEVRNKIRIRIKSDTFRKNIKVFTIQKGLLNIRPNYIDNILNSI